MDRSDQRDALWHWWTAVRIARLHRDLQPFGRQDLGALEAAIAELVAAADDASALSTQVLLELNRLAARWISTPVDSERQGYGNLVRKRVQTLLEQLDAASEAHDECP